MGEILLLGRVARGDFGRRRAATMFRVSWYRDAAYVVQARADFKRASAPRWR